jgi:hypothetical protein
LATLDGLVGTGITPCVNRSSCTVDALLDAVAYEALVAEA